MVEQIDREAKLIPWTNMYTSGPDDGYSLGFQHCEEGVRIFSSLVVETRQRYPEIDERLFMLHLFEKVICDIVGYLAFQPTSVTLASGDSVIRSCSDQERFFADLIAACTADQEAASGVIERDETP